MVTKVIHLVTMVFLFGHQGFPFSYQVLPIGHQGLPFGHQGLPFGPRSTLQTPWSQHPYFGMITNRLTQIKSVTHKQNLWTVRTHSRIVSFIVLD